MSGNRKNLPASGSTTHSDLKPEFTFDELLAEFDAAAKQIGIEILPSISADEITATQLRTAKGIAWSSAKNILDTLVLKGLYTRRQVLSDGKRCTAYKKVE